MIIPSFVQMPVPGVPDPNVIAKATAGSVGGGLSGLLGLGADCVDPNSGESVACPDTGTITDVPPGGATIDPGNIGASCGMGPYLPGTACDTAAQNAAANSLLTQVQQGTVSAGSVDPTLAADAPALVAAGLPAPSTANVVTAGAAGVSAATWEQSMAAALIKTGGQIMNNVTMPAGSLAVRNPNGSVTYYRQPSGSNTNLAVGNTGLGVGTVGVTGNISLPMILLGLGALYLFTQRGR